MASNQSMMPAAGMPSFMEDVRLPPVDASLLVGVGKAIEEITTTPPANLHRTAAYSWGSRAVACFRVCSTKQDLQECLSYFYLGEHYREAALAHAAMGEQWQPLATEIEAAMAEDRARAFAAMRKFSAEPEGGKKAPEQASGQTSGRVSGKKGK